MKVPLLRIKSAYSRMSKLALLIGTFLLLLGLILLAKSPAIAQRPPGSPQIQLIGSTGSTASYRLTIGRPQDIIYVYCPENHAPKLGYLSNVEAIQCE